MATGDNSHFYRNGNRAGFSEYRHGLTKPITLPKIGRHPSRSERKAERADLSNRIADLMRDWDVTPFENEGPVRAGLRSALCLRGLPWEHADEEAAIVTGNALAAIGARRPTREQAQREHTIPRENCGWCAGPLPTDLMPSGHARSYCCTDCARFAISRRNLTVTDESRDAYKAAWRVVAKRRLSQKPCAHCNELFHPMKERQIFCSRACKDEGARTFAPVPCKSCGKIFRPSKGREAHFCSMACYRAKGPTKVYQKICISCGTPFQARSEKARACSKPCQHLQTGWKPSTITRAVFDHFIVLPMDERWRRRMTAERFDWMAMEMGRTITGEATMPAPRITDGLFA